MFESEKEKELEDVYDISFKLEAVDFFAMCCGEDTEYGTITIRRKDNNEVVFKVQLLNDIDAGAKYHTLCVKVGEGEVDEDAIVEEEEEGEDVNMFEYLDNMKEKDAVKDHIRGLMNHDRIYDRDREDIEEMIVEELLHDEEYAEAVIYEAQAAYDNWLYKEGISEEEEEECGYEPNYEYYEADMKRCIAAELEYIIQDALGEGGYTYDVDRRCYISEELREEEELEMKLRFYEQEGMTWEDYLMIVEGASSIGIDL